jgi:hypothetical protein
LVKAIRNGWFSEISFLTLVGHQGCLQPLEDDRPQAIFDGGAWQDEDLPLESLEKINISEEI